MISLIIPTYNEAGNIKTLINQISSVLKNKSYEIIVVDDDSPDKTWQIVKKLQSQNRRIKLCRRLKARGLTSAFNHGIKQARGLIIGWLDADLSHPPQLLKSMVGQLEKYDAVIASRYVQSGKDSRGQFLPVFLSRLINLLAQLLLFKDITDYTSGYILLKRKYLQSYSLEGDYGEYFIHLIYHLKTQSAKIIEVPYISRNRTHGQSKTATNLFGFIRRGKKYLFTIFRLWLKKLSG